MIRILELFGGIGGFAYGIEKALGKEKYEIAGYYDNDKYATAVFNYNFSTKYEPTDIRQVDENDIPRHDLLCAGFPCQAFSIAGKRRGFEDTRGTLFFEIARVLQAKKPPYFLLENVKGLLSHQEGKTFRIILQTLDELGYDLQWMVLNSKFFGVSQNRERVFIIGNLRGKPRPEILPFRENAGEVQEVSGEEIVSSAITTENAHAYGNTMTCGQTLAIARCLDANMWKGATPKEYFEKSKRNIVMIMDYRSDEGFRIRKNRISPTLTSHSDSVGGVPIPMIFDMKLRRLRRLTPLECERLQGFPDNWTKYGYFVDKNEIRKISDTQRYKMLGNAVTVNVIENLIKKWFADAVEG